MQYAKRLSYSCPASLNITQYESISAHRQGLKYTNCLFSHTLSIQVKNPTVSIRDPKFMIAQKGTQ